MLIKNPLLFIMRKQYLLWCVEALGAELITWALFANDARKAVAKIGGRDVYNSWAKKLIRERLAEGFYYVPRVAYLGEKWYNKIKTRSDYSDIVWTCKLIQERIGIVAAAIYPEGKGA
jgi:hypothetical protein